jgi:hypothetical protein
MIEYCANLKFPFQVIIVGHEVAPCRRQAFPDNLKT